MQSKKLILLVVTTVLILSLVDAATLEAQNASVTGRIRADNGVGDTVSNTSLWVGTAGNLSTEYQWNRLFIRFDLSGQTVMQSAELHLFYKDTTTNGTPPTYDVNLQTINDIGNLDASDYYATKFADINSVVFDSTTDENQIIDVTDAWNDAISNGRDYLTLMFVTTDEPTFTSVSNFRYLEFCDVGDTIGDCDGAPTNPFIETTAIPPPITFAINGNARTLASLLPFMLAAVIFLAIVSFAFFTFSNSSFDPESMARDMPMLLIVMLFLLVFYIIFIALVDATLQVTI